jgi:hypothetical protein
MAIKKYRNNEKCPVCGFAEESCGQVTNSDLLLCRKINNKLDTPYGFSWRGNAKNDSQFGMFVKGVDKEARTDEENAQWEEKQRIRLEQSAAEEKKRIARLPKSEQRDREYREKIFRNPLRSNHLADLTRRGLTDEDIAVLKPFSSHRGYAVPIRDINGLMVGAQFKKPGVQGYPWDLRGLNNLAETDQLPLAIWGNTADPDWIILVEGTGVKPYLTSKRFSSAIVIGASSGHFMSSSKQFQQVLNKFPATKIALMPDSQSVIDDQVRGKYSKVNDFIRSLDREMLVGWWGQTTKSAGDIDEISADILIEIISWDRFDQFCNKSWQILKKITRFEDLLHRKRSRTTPQLLEFNRNADEQYVDKSELEDVLSRAVADPNIRAVLDISIPGSGKSTVIGSVRSVVGIDTHIYAHNQHRNPTTETVEIGYSDVTSRHDGLYVNPDKITPLGSHWLQTSKPAGSEWEQTMSNCDLTVEQRIWRETGHADIDGKNPICNLCPHNSICHISSGDGYGYKHQRNSALAQSRIRISPMSLPNPATNDYSKTLLIWDDQEQTTTRSISATSAQIDSTIAQLLTTDSQLAIDLEPIFTSIKTKLREKSRFGFGMYAIVGEVEIDNIADKLHRVATILSPDLSKLKIGDAPDRLSSLEKHGFTIVRDNITLDKIAPNWLVSLLEIMSGSVVGTAHTVKESIVITQKDSYHQTIASKTALTLVMDATKSREDLALELGISTEQIRVISQPIPVFENLTINMIDGMGSPTKDRTDSKNAQISAAAIAIAQKHGDCSTIDKVKECVDRGLWFRDSVGSNAYRMDSALLLIGAPTRNLGALSRLFTCLTGVQTEADSKNPDFLAYVRRDVAANVIQAVGRLRAQHRPNAELNVYIACDRDDFPISEMMSAYPGGKLKAIAAEDITIDAVGSRHQLRIRIAQLILDNPNILQAEVAMSLCVSTSNISKIFKEHGSTYKAGLLSLYKAFYSESKPSNSQLGDWVNALDPAVAEHVENVLDSPSTDIEVKAQEIAIIVDSLTSHQLTALYHVIGEGKANFFVELMRLNLALLTPSPSSLVDIDILEAA